jgi:predicted DNA-binding protein (MmcQ/YjbR family)
MNVEELRDFCVGFSSVTEEFPFDNDTLVFKVAGKMFALVSLSNPVSVNIKCDPEKALEWRSDYDAVKPGFHMSKTHWNTVFFNQDVSDQLLLSMIKDSYNLVVKGLPKKIQQQINNAT